MDRQQINKAKNDVSRAERARMIMQDEMLQEALMAIKADIYKKFMSTRFKESEDREELWRKSQVVDKFELYLERVMSDGKIATATLSSLERAKKIIGL